MKRRLSSSATTSRRAYGRDRRALARIPVVSAALSGRSVPAARAADAQADHEACDAHEHEDTADPVPVMDSDEYRDPESEQGNTSCKPEPMKLCQRPSMVARYSVYGSCRLALRAASGVTPERWPQPASSRTRSC